MSRILAPLVRGGEVSAIAQALGQLVSERKVRRVVIPTGKRARGRFPSLKAGDLPAQFESLVEEAVLRLCEISPDVVSVETHPFVLCLPLCDGTDKILHYTPDLVIELDRAPWLAVVEVKGDYLLRTDVQRQRLRAIGMALRHHNIPFLVLLGSDISVEMSDALKELLRTRQWPRFGTRGVATEQPKAPEHLAWQRAELQCNQLLARLMTRDVDGAIAAAQMNGSSK